jgi:anti-sigma factor RsiW
MQDISSTYRSKSDDDLILIHADFANLTSAAREALWLEMQSRDLSENQAAAAQEQWKRRAAEKSEAQRQERKERLIGWRKIAAQFAIVLAVGIVFGVVAGNTVPSTEDVQRALGSLIAYASLLSLGIAVGFFRGRLVATLITTLTVYAAVWLFLLR